MRRQYYIKKFSNINSIKQNWKNINSFLSQNWQDSPIKIILNIGQLMEGGDLAEFFNRYFTSIGSEIAATFSNDIDYNFFNLIQSIPNFCVMVPSTNEEVDKIIKDLPNKVNCLFDISCKLLKQASRLLSPIVSYLYNECLLSGVYPSNLKAARVVPIYKSGNHSSLNNYRPISNSSLINKVFERLTYNRLISNINNFQLISKYQHCFIKNSNTTLAAFRLISNIFRSQNMKQYTMALFLDLRKAFDTVDRNILIKYFCTLSCRV